MSQFDTIYQRRGTGDIKYDLIPIEGLPEDTIPLWVADMDFAPPECVGAALRDMTTPGIFGYHMATGDYRRSVISWMDRRLGWAPQEEWMVETPGVVFALCTAVRAFTQPGDGVAMLMPVYHQFFHAVEHNGRRVVAGHLKQVKGRWEIDFAELERVLDEEKPKLFFLCSPHNPVGRVWTREELVRLGEICFARNILVAADEIHCDFVYPGHTQVPFLSLGEEFRRMSFSCTAPSKTFNLAGLECSNLFFPNPDLRRAFQRELTAQGVNGCNTAGLVACKAAYDGGEAWLEELLGYLGRSYEYLVNFATDRLPGVEVSPLEGTYLAWVDVRGLGLTPEEEQDLLRARARVWISPGSDYGPGGEGFWRINLACPRSVLAEALERIREAL